MPAPSSPSDGQESQTSVTSWRSPRKYQPPRKLTAEQIVEAVEFYQGGQSLGMIALTMGVTRQAIHDLLKRRIILRDRIAALPRKEPTAIRRHRDINRKRYRARAARITAAQMRTVRERDQVCRACGTTGTDFDHILPVADGGQTTLDNLQLLCHPCHIVKSRRDWYGSRQRSGRVDSHAPIFPSPESEQG